MPRTATRTGGATPARSTRAASVVPQGTPGARKSTRAAARNSLGPRDIVANPALPEIQIQQSYAYGSSKTPALPEQLQARDLRRSAVANRLNEAVEEAERNFETHAAELRDPSPVGSQKSARDVRAQKRASKESSQPPTHRGPPSETPDDVRKQNRTNAWLNGADLDNIPEENSRDGSSEIEPTTPQQDRQSSVPSSFPTGSFNHSYNYERGERAPKLPQPEPDPGPEAEAQPEDTNQPEAEAQVERQAPAVAQRQYTSFITRTKTRIKNMYDTIIDWIQAILTALYHWLARMVQMMQKSLHDLPDSPVTEALFKSLCAIVVLSIAGLAFCAIFTRTCNASSVSIVSQSLQRFCGQCSSSTLAPLTTWNLTDADSNDMNVLLKALQQTQTQIAQIESRLSSRLDSSLASQSAETATLRSHQENLELQIRRLNSQHNPAVGQAQSNDVASPLIAKMNFFSPSSGALIIPGLTSPTRAKQYPLPIRVALQMAGFRNNISPPPIAALEPWQDEGDCWCAADVPKQAKGKQDSARLGIRTSQQIYPTELVIEHFPSSGALEPGVAPRELELWADFAHLSEQDFAKLHVQDLVDESAEDWLVLGRGSRAKTWARVGSATYAISLGQVNSEGFEMDAGETYEHVRRNGIKTSAKKAVDHVQRFNLAINQNGLLHYSDRYVLRVQTNHGSDHTCLYRVRLHGLPLDWENR